MKILLIVEFVINALLVLGFHIHMFQQNSYFIKKNMHWMSKNMKKILVQLLFIIISAVFIQLDKSWSQIVAVIILAVSILLNCPKGKSKVPLKITHRVQRLFITILALNAIILCTFGIENYTFIKLELINALAVFICMIANIINYPIEAMGRRWYINDAKRILKDCPNLIVVGVTGSYGKTSVKNFLAKTLSAKYEVLATPQNYNTTMGVVKTIRENLKSTHQVFVCEMGATKPNDIKEICDIVHPQYGVITSVGPQHLESFKSIENVLKTKMELADSVRSCGGVVFMNGNNEYIVQYLRDCYGGADGLKSCKSNGIVTYGVNDESLDFNGFDLHSSEKGVSFKVKAGNSGDESDAAKGLDVFVDSADGEKYIEFTTKAIGRHNVTNVMAAIAVANQLGVKIESMVPRVKEIKNVEHRLQLLEIGNLNVIDDSYNSNPVSSKLAVDTLGEFDGVKIIITPGLIELGNFEDQYNIELGKYIAKVCDYAFFVGDHSRKVQEGIRLAGYDESRMFVVGSPQEAMQKIIELGLNNGEATVLIENDLPDNWGRTQSFELKLGDGLNCLSRMFESVPNFKEDFFMKIKLGVFFGGNSVEHEVSIITAIQATENVDKEKYDVIPIYITKQNKMYCGELIGDIRNYKNIDDLIAHSTQVTLAQKDDKVALVRCDKKLFENVVYDYIDIAFPIVHGTNVEDGTLQGFLKMFNLPYVGCDVVSSAVGMDKYIFKCLLKENGIPVINCKCFTIDQYNASPENITKVVEENIAYPVIVKPVNLGSSVGIKIAKDRRALEDAVADAFGYARKVLVERAVMNLKEINCSVIGDYEECEASECEEPVKTDEILSFNDKYISGGKKLGGVKGTKSANDVNEKSMNAGVTKLPAEISTETRARIQELSKKTFKVLGCSGVVRIDFIIDQDSNEIFVNEINTIPGSLSFHLWKATNLKYKDLLDKVINLALKRQREEKNMTFSFESNILAGYENGFGGTKGIKGKMAN